MSLPVITKTDAQELFGAYAHRITRLEEKEFKYGTEVNTRKLKITTDMLVSDVYSEDPVYIYDNENMAYIPDIPETTSRGLTYRVEGGLIYITGAITGSGTLVINVPTRVPYNWANQYVYGCMEVVSGTITAGNVRLLAPATYLNGSGNEVQIALISANSAISLKAISVLDDARIQISSTLNCTDLVLRPYFALRNQANKGSGITNKPTAGRITVSPTASYLVDGIMMTMSGANFTANVLNKYPMNALFGKKMALCGDSIAEGHGADSFGYTIAENQNMAFDKPAIGTARLASSSPVTSIPDQVYSLENDYDYILVEGGINDALNGVALGEITESFSSEFDETTALGGLETICKNLVEEYPNARKLFILCHKCTNKNYTPYAVQDRFFEAMKTVLKKWNIPYIDLRDYPLCAYNSTFAATYFDTDFSTVGGLHPNNAGYELGYIDQITNALLTDITGGAGTKGADGAPGNGVQSVDLNGSSHLIVTYDNGSTHDAGAVSGGAPIDDTTPAANKVYSSQKTATELNSKFDADNATITGGGEELVDHDDCLYNWKPDMTVGASYSAGSTVSGGQTTNLWPYSSNEKIKFSISSLPSYIRVLIYDSNKNVATMTGAISQDTDGNYVIQVSKSGAAYMCIYMVASQAVFDSMHVGRYNGFGQKHVVINDLYLSDDNVDMVRERVGYTKDILHGKKWAVAGDSFSSGDGIGETIPSGPYAGHYAVYPYLIANRHNMDLGNFFAGGKTLALPSDGSSTNAFAYDYQNIAADTDYLTIYLGINDSHHASSQTGQIAIGTISDNTTATFYGAWNVILSWLIENRPNLHIGIIVSHGCDSDDYRTATIAIAQKYGIPYIDLNGDSRTPCMIRSSNANIASAVRTQRTLNWRVSSENAHPNAACHAYEATFIEDFLRTL